MGLQDERVLVEDDASGGGEYADFVTLVEAQHGYPATRLQWQPAGAAAFAWSQKAPGAELLATTGDALRVWEYASDAPPAPGTGYVGRQAQGPGHRLTLKTALSGVSGCLSFLRRSLACACAPWRACNLASSPEQGFGPITSRLSCRFHRRCTSNSVSILRMVLRRCPITHQSLWMPKKSSSCV